MGYQNVLIDEYEYTTLSLSQILARQNFGPWQLHVWNPQFSSGSHNSLTGLNWLAPWMIFFFLLFATCAAKTISRDNFCLYFLSISPFPLTSTQVQDKRRYLYQVRSFEPKRLEWNQQTVKSHPIAYVGLAYFSYVFVLHNGSQDQGSAPHLFVAFPTWPMN